MSKNGITDEVLSAEYDAVYHYCLTFCKSENEARDITQEAFLKAFGAKDNFHGNSSLYTWLCRIAKNLYLNRLKRLGREIPTEQLPENGDKISLENYIDGKEGLFYIHKILHKLDEPYKEVFSLRVFGELPFADIAGLFSKTESWARVTYHRARKSIIEQIRKDGYYEK